MVLCKKCAHTVRVSTLRCPRCGWKYPYFRSRRWRWRAIFLPKAPLAFGKDCPCCGRRTTRRHTPAWLKPLKLFLGEFCTYRRCERCLWKGASFHGRPQRVPVPAVFAAPDAFLEREPVEADAREPVGAGTGGSYGA